MRLFPSTLLALALTLSALPSPAQPAPGAPSAAGEERRTRLFREGKAAADAGQWDEAAEKFRQVVKLRSAPKALIALGVAEERRGKLTAALAAYKQAREEAADQTLTDDLKTANTALESIRPRIPRIVLSPPDALHGATVELDGATVRADDGVLLTDPGEHTLAATSPDKGVFSASFSLREGVQHRVSIVFSPATGPTSTGTEPDLPPPGKGGLTAPPTGAIVLGAAGVALVGVGGALYGVGSGEYAKSDALCPGPGCTEDVLASGNGGRAQIITGDILMIAGGLALAGGVAWWIVSATSSKKQEPSASMFIAPRANGIQIGGRF